MAEGSTARYDRLVRSPSLCSVVNLKLPALLFSACITGFFTGCSSVVAPSPPPHWQRDAAESTQNFRRNRSRLQIIVTYDPTTSTHAAMRLTNAGDGALFWDPAGRYAEIGTGRYHVKRVNDLIVENGPTLETYWESSVNASDIAMEVFEWDLREADAQRIRQALLRGAGIEPGRNDFHTKTMKPFCSLAVSSFLSSFAADPVSLESRYLLPHSLAEALYRQYPHRVFVFRRGQQISK